jgi:transcriptional regulator with XRE-family HTH domain
MPQSSRLQRWRVTKKLTQEALANRLGVSQEFVSQLEAGARMPGLKLASKIEQETHGAVKATSWVGRQTQLAS